MLFKTLSLIASAALATAVQDIYLVVKSDNTEINGNTLGFLHSGAGINYAFLGTAAKSDVLEYDESTKALLYYDGGISFGQAFDVSGGYVRVSVEGQDSDITFNGNTLAVNGTTDAFYACKNTGDPYDYSAKSYELMYYTENVPSGCISLTLEKTEASVSSTVSSLSLGTSSSTTSASSSSSSSASPSPSVSDTFEGAAAQFAPVGAFAAVFGAAVALL